MSFYSSERPWLLNRRLEAIRASSSSLFTFDFDKKPKKAKAKTNVAKVKTETAVSKSNGTEEIISQKENSRRSLIPVKRKVHFEDSDDGYDEEEESFVENVEIKKRKKWTKKRTDKGEISSNSSETSEIKPRRLRKKRSRKTSNKKFDAVNKTNESETNPNYDIVQDEPREAKGVQGKEENSSSLEPYKVDASVELIVDPDMGDYFSLENSREMGNVVIMKESDLAQTIQFAQPKDMVPRQVYKGVNAESFSITEGTVTGYLTIAPRTIKPMEITPNTRLIYWILEGEVTVKSTTHVSCNGVKILHGKQLRAGCCIVVPPKTPYMLINRSAERNAILGYVLLSS